MTVSEVGSVVSDVGVTDSVVDSATEVEVVVSEVGSVVSDIDVTDSVVDSATEVGVADPEVGAADCDVGVSDSVVDSATEVGVADPEVGAAGSDVGASDSVVDSTTGADAVVSEVGAAGSDVGVTDSVGTSGSVVGDVASGGAVPVTRMHHTGSVISSTRISSHLGAIGGCSIPRASGADSSFVERAAKPSGAGVMSLGPSSGSVNHPSSPQVPQASSDMSASTLSLLNPSGCHSMMPFWNC
ncbi:hypothetical protein [Rhodococcus sp. APC 3903]|uniref:hypothetical protein n=1 Tax=Rhodococcus sp. APC 3903 TaxID=3035193 RepID=UPI0025B320C9|nr:hypothetical protein [Rhodococcus sp. APC 3903]MDN3460510.1 hypothetical protein [Rhodococcus sp. APC 3903]